LSYIDLGCTVVGCKTGTLISGSDLSTPGEELMMAVINFTFV